MRALTRGLPVAPGGGLRRRAAGRKMGQVLWVDAILPGVG